MADNDKLAFDLLKRIVAASDTAEKLRQLRAEYEEMKESIPEWQKEGIIEAIETAKKRRMRRELEYSMLELMNSSSVKAKTKIFKV